MVRNSKIQCYVAHAAELKSANKIFIDANKPYIVAIGSLVTFGMLAFDSFDLRPYPFIDKKNTQPAVFKQKIDFFNSVYDHI